MIDQSTSGLKQNTAKMLIGQKIFTTKKEGFQMSQTFTKIYKIFESLSVSVAAHRLAQMGYHEEAKRLMMERD